MLAKFENGYFLEVLHNVEDNEYVYSVYDEDGDEIDYGWTEYRNIEMYFPRNEIDYILKFCEPCDLYGKYKLISVETMENYKKQPQETQNKIDARQVANWLNSEATDEEFAEVFALLDIAIFGRGIPENYNQETIIKNADYDGFCKTLNIMLSNIKRRE